MPDQPKKSRFDVPALYQRWTHSREEDTATEMVYRPANYDFPLARGRESFELRRDGELIEGRIGPTDRPLNLSAHWRLLEGSRLAFYDPSTNPGTGRDKSAQPKRAFEIASVDDDRLVLKK